MIKLSVITTFYNNSKYIKNCIKNIKSITNTNIEVIIIDDGSKKEEFDLLKKSIKSIHNKNLVLLQNGQNMGAGYSKNRAIDVAKGEYIIFLDCDDYVSDNYFENILKSIDETSADCIITDIYMKTENNTYKEPLVEFNINKEKIELISDNNYIIPCKKVLGNKYSASACNKAIKKELYKKYKFAENKCDDLTAVIPILCTAKKLVYIKGINYYYCQTNNSITRQTNSKNKIKSNMDSIDSLFKTFEILKEEDVIESKIETYYANNVIPFIHFSILNSDFTTCRKSLKYLISKINSKNFAGYLTIKNPYLYRLEYLSYYSQTLFKLIFQKRYYFLITKIFTDRIKYKLNTLIRRII